MDAPFRVTLPKGRAAERDERGRKRCRDCDRWLPSSAFAKHPRTTDGLRAHCRACNVTQRLLYAYGLTREDYNRMLSEQDHKCAICETTDPGRWWCVDHDHACCGDGTRTCGDCIRGIICDACNVGIGRFSDSPERLRAAAAYLERFARRVA